MKTSRRVALAILMLSPLLASAAQYTCTTEFGEAVPLRSATYKNGKLAPDLTSSWNEAVRTDKNLTSKIKSAEYGNESEKVVFEWRYAKRTGPSFALEVQCPAKGKCSGSFPKAEESAALDLEANLFDQRFPSRRGYVQIRLGNREELAFRVRVFKETAATAEPTKVISGSGEHMILNLEPRFILDVGVDDHLKLSRDHAHRTAALEIKIRCELDKD